MRAKIAELGKDLPKDALGAPKNASFGFGPATASLSLNGSKFAASLDTAESCDASFKHCTRPTLDAPTRIAEELRNSLTRNFGRLPPPMDEMPELPRRAFPLPSSSDLR